MPTLKQLEANIETAEQALADAHRRLAAARGAVTVAHDTRHRLLVAYFDAPDRTVARSDLAAANQKVADMLAAYDQVADEYAV